jgi:hypothetical protein
VALVKSYWGGGCREQTHRHDDTVNLPELIK